MAIKYSIIIPTYNRAEYVFYAIKSVLQSPRLDIELIVSDNLSTDNTKEVLNNFSDPRLKIIRPPVILPMSGHYEFALNQASGEWVTILGDDDAVMPYIFDSLDKYIGMYPDIDIISSTRAYYFWKGCEDLYGNLVVAYSSRLTHQKRSTKTDLAKVLLGFKSCFNMPQVYTTGIIKRSLYNEIKLKSGGYFYHSIIPDLYSLVALCLSRSIYLRIEEPLFWVGTSNKSMGRSGRIYLDAKNLTKKSNNYFTGVPKKISNQISYLLHSSSFDSMYIYECLLQSPIASKKYKSKFLRILVLAVVHSKVIKKKYNLRIKLKDEILLECKKYQISNLLIKFLSFFILFSSLAANFILLPKKIFKRFGIFGHLVFRSNKRQDYPNILDASLKIENLRKQYIKI